MRNFTRYDKTTGEIICIVSCSDDQPIAQDTASAGFVTGHYKAADFHVINGAPVAKPVKPEGFYKWDYVVKKWTPDVEKAAEALAAKEVIDKIKAEEDKAIANLAWLDNFIKTNGGK